MVMQRLPRRHEATSDGHYWALLRAAIPQHRFWIRWNLDYTKRVLTEAPGSQQAAALLDCWPPRIRQALWARFGLATQA